MDITNEQILDMAEGGQMPEGMEEEPKVEEVEQEQEEQEAADEVEETEEDDTEEEDIEEPEDKPKRKRTLKDDVIKQRQRAQAAEQQIESLRSDFRSVREENEQLRAFIQKHMTQEETVEDEPIDKEHFEKFDKKLKETTSGTEERLFRQELRLEDVAGQQKYGADYIMAKNHLLAADAYDIKQEYESIGESITNEQALALAMRAIDADMREVHKRGRSIADYLYKRATRKGYATGIYNENGEYIGQKEKINMKEAARARKEAGAPNVKRASADAAKYDFDSLVNEFMQEGAA